ncbi:hypothetical protein HDU76_012899 [Blyttiomyces sp. JEL0837]|nr:hypothetical protein HDU76_012899 [Blyttiomyces sp. JEL0837]
MKPAPPGTHSTSLRVNKVAFAPTKERWANPESFLALEGRRIFIWDMAAEKVVACETTSFDQLMSASWSPHPPYASLIATAGVDHHVSVLDARLMGMDTERAVIWKVERAHGGHFHPSIGAVEFSPFVPYWLASAGEDSVVRIWDLRYTKDPAGRIEGHYHGIHSLTWSSTHAEILATGSSDRSIKAWYLDPSMVPSKTRLEFEMVVLRYNILVDAIKGSWENIVKAEKMILKGMEMDPTFMEPDTLKLLIETVLPNDFIRGLSIGARFAEVVEDTSRATGSSRFIELSGLIGLLLFPTVFETSYWFQEPANTDKNWADGRGPLMRQAWIKEYIDAADSDARSPAGGASGTTGGLVGEGRRSTISNYSSGSSGMTRGSVSAKPNLTAKRPSNRIGALPTIVAEGTTDPEMKRTSALLAIMSSSKEVMRMLKTESRILKFLAKGPTNEQAADEIIKIVTSDGEVDDESVEMRRKTMQGSLASLAVVSNSSYKPTISAFTNKLFMDALLATRRFEEYFQICVEFWAAIAAATGADLKDSAVGSAMMEEVFAVIDRLGKVAKPQV